MAKRHFLLQAHGTSIRCEGLGGGATVATMAHVIVVNPSTPH